MKFVICAILTKTERNVQLSWGRWTIIIKTQRRVLIFEKKAKALVIGKIGRWFSHEDDKKRIETDSSRSHVLTFPVRMRRPVY